MIKCILFDCDGVLVNSEPITRRIMNELLQEYAPQEDWATRCVQLKGRSLDDYTDALAKAMGKARAPEAFVSRYRTASAEAFLTELDPIEGMPQLLSKLQLPICVASNGPQSKILPNLKTCALLPHFEQRIFSAYDIKKWKPLPDLFLYAAQKMGYTPEQCLVVEDSVAGVQAAVAGGFRVFALAHEQADAAPLAAAGAERVVASVTELEAAFVAAGIQLC